MLTLGSNRRSPKGVLLLEDGSCFEGEAVAPGTRFGEVVFNTSMTGYQEILTDPSYRGQIVVMTQPHMGNYGMSDEADESRQPWVEGFLARQFSTVAPRGEALPEYLSRHGLPAIEGIDTRALVRRLRRNGCLKGVMTTERTDVEALAEELAAFPSMSGRSLVDEVSCKEPYELGPLAGEARFHLAVYDFGVKANILRHLQARGARLTVLPAHTSAAECLGLGVDGVVLSNGPGDPEPLASIQQNVAELVASNIPLFGICLGHQLLALALGGRTVKLKFGHHGGNQPVRDIATGQVTITSQNHGFAVVPESLPESCTATDINLNDGTLEGFAVTDRPVFAVQYHPEAAPGPQDASGLFDRFLAVVGDRAGAHP
ncbi:MAG: glutamine-hydrolyzing carbamoyl-phosphate synthase small subunit [Deltaproteobacteria bacterium]|nr:glutamine-hydrolyzing carbamoyl-phosphate synthase small subunit [Deltaproteobacteria bacterium]